MKAVKTLFITAIFAMSAISPALHAADVFVSHFEPLSGMKAHTAEHLRTDTSPEQQQAAPMVLSFEAMGRRFDLDLVPNDRVLAALPKAGEFAGVSAYRGQLVDNADSWARIVMFDGMPRGLVWDGETMYVIDAPGDSALDISAPVMYRLSDLNILPGTMTCGTSSIEGNAAKVYANMKGEWSTAVSQGAGATSEITMSVISDAQFTSAKGGEAGAAAALTARLNNVDGWFSEQVGVQLTVEYVDTYTSANDPFDGTLDPGELLSQLSEHRQQTPALNSRGLTHLYTGRDFTGTTVGIAWNGAICSSFLSAGLTQGTADLITDSLIAAHEIGHNFGAEHDGEAGRSCESEPQTYIMAPSVTGSQQFSACSIGVMQAEAAGAFCVTALPSVDVGIGRDRPLSNVLLGASTVIDYEVAATGTLNVSDVVASFNLPSVLSLDSVATTAGNCESGAGTVSCNLGNLTGLSSQTVTLTVTPVAVGSGTLSASVTTPDDDERSGNDQDTLQLTVDPAVDLVVNSPSTSPAFVDTNTTVTVQLDNVSTLDATNVSLSVSLASGLQASSADWSLGTCSVSARQVDCQASRFAAMSSSSLSITAAAVATGMQDVSVSITSSEADADTSNNSESRAVNVVAPQSEDDSGGGGGSTNPLLLLLLGLVAVSRLGRRPQ